MAAIRISMYTINNIIEFLKSEIGDEQITANTDIVKELGTYGDDLDALLISYSDNFNVELNNYLWYFHSKEKGLNIGTLFFKAPNQRVERIIITPEILKLYANTGKWEIPYPAHNLPKCRYDIIIENALIILIIGIMILFSLIEKWLKLKDKFQKYKQNIRMEYIFCYAVNDYIRVVLT